MPSRTFRTRVFPGGAISSGGGGGSVYLLQEDFDTGNGVTPPAGWTVPGGGTYSYSNTSPALPQGGNNLSIVSSLGDDTCKSFTNQTGEVWGYAQFRIVSIPAGSAQPILSFNDGGTYPGTPRCFVKINIDGTLQIWDSQFEAASTIGALSGGTNYHIWWHYKPDPGGGNGVIDVGFSTNGIRPTSGSNFIQKPNTTEVSNVSRIGLYVTDANITQYFDHILVNNSQIGDNP